MVEPQNTKTQGTGLGRRLWLAVPLVLLALAILLGLGTWQVERLFWKEALLATIEERSTAAPASLAALEAEVADGHKVGYRRLRLSGVFDHGKERHFFATHRGRTGYYVYTPLTLPDNRVIFINRGFVPYEKKEPSTRPAGQVAGAVTIEGLARNVPAAKPSAMLPDNDLRKNIFYWKDLGAMADSVGIARARLVPLFMDADETPNPGGLPHGGVTLLDMPNNHLQYAITWFGLALALVIVAGFAYWRSVKARRE